MNLLISLPAGILLILLSFYLFRKFSSLSIYGIAGILAIAVVAVYTASAAIVWPGVDVFAIHIAIYLLTVYANTIILHSRRSSTGKMHWAPITIVSFFVVLLIVDSIFIILAQSGMGPDWVKRILPEPRGGGEVVSAFPGVVSHDFREKQNQFNDYQQQRAIQLSRGWQVKVGWQSEAYANKPNTLLIEIRTKDNKLVNNAQVKGTFFYPASMRLDHTFTMQVAGNGLYSSEITLPKVGKWDLVLNIEKDQAVHEVRSSTTINKLEP